MTNSMTMPELDRTLAALDKQLLARTALAFAYAEAKAEARSWYGRDDRNGLVLLHPTAPGRLACGCAATILPCDTCTAKAHAAAQALVGVVRPPGKVKLLAEREGLLRLKARLNAALQLSTGKQRRLDTDEL